MMKIKKINENKYNNDDSIYGYIYKITNDANNKVYIGQAMSIDWRWYNHKRNAFARNEPQALYKAMRKYGIEHFSIEQIDTAATKDELNRKEIYWIEKYQSYKSLKGYNRTKGGDGGNTWDSRSEEDKKSTSALLSMKSSGANNPSFGKHWWTNGAEQVYQVECSPGWHAGNSDIVRQHHSEAQRDHKRTDAQKERIRQSKLGDKNPSKQKIGMKQYINIKTKEKKFMFPQDAEKDKDLMWITDYNHMVKEEGDD